MNKYVKILFLALLTFPRIVYGGTDDFSDEDLPYEMTGFIRQLFDWQRPTSITGEQTTLFTSESNLRLGFEYKNEENFYEAKGSADFNVRYSPQAPSRSYKIIWNSEIRNRLMPLEAGQKQGKTNATQTVHRLSIARKTPKVHIVLGRQAISWGQGRLINPLDLITPAGPFILDTEDLPGADAVNLTYFNNPKDSVQIVLIPYRRENQRDPNRLNIRDLNLLMRYQFTVDNTETTLMGGRHFHSWVIGGEIVITKWDANIRMAYLGRYEEEIISAISMMSNPTPRLSHQVVFGMSYAFLRGKLRTNIEFFYNSAFFDDNLTFPTMMALNGFITADMTAPLPEDNSFFQYNGQNCFSKSISYSGFSGT